MPDGSHTITCVGFIRGFSNTILFWLRMTTTGESNQESITTATWIMTPSSSCRHAPPHLPLSQGDGDTTCFANGCICGSCAVMHHSAE
jgi:hypothetical protein